MEENIDQNKTLIGSIKTEFLGDCSHIEYYKNSQNFKFLPGHRLFILKFSESLPEADGNDAFQRAFQHPAFSPLLQNLIQTALKNYDKSSTNKRYSNLLTDFAIYIYIMAGKAVYEVIAANLPLPSTSTIGNYILNLVLNWILKIYKIKQLIAFFFSSETYSKG